MQRSTNRILTTHTGSLPRPQELEQAMLKSLDGEPQDPERMRSLIHDGTISVVRRQVECGVDIVNDGEFGKPSYSTYVQDRLNGFGGESEPLNIQDLPDYPGSEEGLMNDPGFGHLVHPACNGPVTRKDGADAAVRSDIALLKEALSKSDAT